ncbi:MAG: GreA/GreB family elongation factor [Verrucomicrobia bacterium]|nr:GreA/GreB family elongation factor [Verrucomicrobiota bacterium]
MDIATLEEQFLEKLEAEHISATELIGMLKALPADEREEARSLAELLQDALRERDDKEAGLKLLALRAQWAGTDAGFRNTWKEVCLGILGNTPESRAIITSSGIDNGVGLRECLRRLKTLRTLEKGVMCHDKTWGFGVVSSIDHFYARAEIDFERKKEHEMSFQYAAESLELINEDHLMARKHNDPAALAALVANDPAEVVRITLRSYGSMPIAFVQERLVPSILSESDWKGFWDGARKALKKDPLVEIPAKRSEPIVLHDEEQKVDEKWFASLAEERDMEKILGMVELLNPEDMAVVGEKSEEIIGERLAFVVKGAGRRRPGLLSRVLVSAQRLNIPAQYVDTGAAVAELLKEPVLLDAVGKLGAIQIRALFAALLAADRERVLAAFLDLVPEFSLTSLNEAMDVLLKNGRESEVRRIYQESFNDRSIDVQMLNWLMRHHGKYVDWAMGSEGDLAERILAALEHDRSGDHLKAQNQLRERFRKDDWLKSALAAMNETRRREFLLRIKESSAWPAMDRRSVMGQMVKMFPELQAALSGDASSAPASASKGPVTSERSYKERQAQLENIQKVEIPENSKEIAVARSYGDLRENFEYKAAKDMQKILFRREEELQTMLQEVKPTDFSGYPSDRVGVATGVRLEYPDGRTEMYYILGAWDRDEELGIISSETRMARALAGSSTGEEVTVPAEDGEVKCRIREVLPLSESVKAWLAHGLD